MHFPNLFSDTVFSLLNKYLKKPNQGIILGSQNDKKNNRNNNKNNISCIK